MRLPVGRIRSSRKVWLAGSVIVVAAVVAGVACSPGPSRSSYVDKANQTCVSGKRGLDNKHKPQTTQDGIDYALNYFTDLDKTVSRLRELTEPANDSGRLHKLWLDPAAASLQNYFRNDLPTVRRASDDGDAAVVHREIVKMRHIAGDGVDRAYLRSVGLTGCLPLFSSAS